MINEVKEFSIMLIQVIVLLFVVLGILSALSACGSDTQYENENVSPEQRITSICDHGHRIYFDKYNGNFQVVPKDPSCPN